MPVTSITKDPSRLTMTLTAELDAGVERAWQLWADPRQLERWWGPPTFPATFVDHDLVTGGRASYYMTGPEGEKPHGWWEIVDARPPHRLELRDGFADDSGHPDPAMPTMVMVVTLDASPSGGTVMVVETRFPSTEAMEQLIGMGMEEGFASAAGQIDGILEAEAA